MSTTKTLVESLVSGIAGAFVWDTAPEAVWFFDGNREELQDAGLSLAVMGSGRPLEQFTRAGPLKRFEIMLAVYAAVDNGVDPLTDGDEVVSRAEELGEWLFNRQVNALNCVEVNHEPLISQDFFRECRLWVSVLKTGWR